MRLPMLAFTWENPTIFSGIGMIGAIITTPISGVAADPYLRAKALGELSIIDISLSPQLFLDTNQPGRWQLSFSTKCTKIIRSFCSLVVMHVGISHI